jgi:hypothetical protein
MEEYKFKIRLDGKYWYWKGELHREGDKPAEIYANGSKMWYWKGLRHREEDKPAVIWKDGRKVYYKNGERIDK